MQNVASPTPEDVCTLIRGTCGYVITWQREITSKVAATIKFANQLTL